MTYVINREPHNGTSFDLPDNTVIILIGKNGSGKSRILESLKSQINDCILLKGNYENIEEIQTINLSQAENRQRETSIPTMVASIISSNSELFKIFQFYFKSLFGLDLKIQNNVFSVNNINLNLEADGLKSLFNLCYYLLSPHKILLLDEPERFFHPSLNSIFLNLLSKIACNYKKTIVFSTHSSNMIRFDLPNLLIYRVSKSPSKILNINNWLATMSNNVYPSNSDNHSLKDWFGFHSDLVFGNYIILVEGFSDQITLEALKQKLSFEYRLEDLIIKPVASSYHDSGGKTRLHKIQTFLDQLIPTYVIADKDIIGNVLKKWFSYNRFDKEEEIFNSSKKSKLLILSKGELEDYYFVDPSYDVCNTFKNAKKYKIAAAYEQASIINSKSFEEVENQYRDIIEFFKSVVIQNNSFEATLGDLAKDFIIDRHLKNLIKSDHFTESDQGESININFNFLPSHKGFTFKKLTISEIEQTNEKINKELRNNYST